MKKTKALSVLSVCVLLACAAVFLFTAGDRPFKDLDAAEIASADVHLIPRIKRSRSQIPRSWQSISRTLSFTARTHPTPNMMGRASLLP